jgi:hypothetical protein
MMKTLITRLIKRHNKFVTTRHAAGRTRSITPPNSYETKRNNPRTSSNEQDIKKSHARIIEQIGYRDEKRGGRKRHYRNTLVVEGWCHGPNAGAVVHAPSWSIWI